MHVQGLMQRCTCWRAQVSCKLVYNISDDKVSNPIFIRMAVNPEHVGSIVDAEPHCETESGQGTVEY